ncbi:hypothetical protein BC940DRAFT_295708 [Gongronella butleri]|nr:hypothetical protein BC940DRAFT_295708 [Gongronella butleri]
MKIFCLSLFLTSVWASQQFCCDAVVQSQKPPGQIGINCFPGGIDCGFSGQVSATCASLSPIGAQHGTGVGCQ